MVSKVDVEGWVAEGFEGYGYGGCCSGVLCVWACDGGGGGGGGGCGGGSGAAHGVWEAGEGILEDKGRKCEFVVFRKRDRQECRWCFAYRAFYFIAFEVRRIVGLELYGSSFKLCEKGFGKG